MSRIGALTPKYENPHGLHARYLVGRIDGTPIKNGAEFFVLRLDNDTSDLRHVEACRKAVLVYADEIEDHIPQLAEDIRNRWGVNGRPKPKR